MNSTPKTLWHRRTKLGLSRATLAREIDYTETTIYCWETGRSIPDHARFDHWRRGIVRLEKQRRKVK